MIHVMNFEGEIIDFISAKDVVLLEAKHVRNINERIETFEFTVVSERATHLQQRNRILIQDKNDRYREFIIQHMSQDIEGNAEVECVASYLEDLSKAKPMPPGKLDKKTTKEALREVLNDTGWEVSDDTEYGGVKTTDWDAYRTRYEVALQLCTTYKMMLDFYIEVGANRVSNRYVVLRKRAPLFKGKEITYGKDLSGLKRTVDFSEVNTALLCVGPEQEDKKRLEVVVKDDKAQEKFGLPNDYNWGIYEPTTDNDKMTKERLQSLGVTELNKRKREAISYEVTALDIQREQPHEVVNLGDSVRIKNRDFNPPLYVEAEVISEEFDMISKDVTYTFGQFKEFKESDLRDEFDKRLDAIRAKLNDGLTNVNTIVKETLEGQLQYFERKIIKSPTPPENPVNDMFWLDTSNPDVAVLRRYWNGKWIKASPEKAGDIGAISREQALYSELKNTFINLTIQHSRLLKEVSEVTESEYLTDSDIKKRINQKLDATITVFDAIKKNLDSMTEETATIGKLVDTQALFLEYRKKLQELYNEIENAKVSINERFRLLQSQYTDEKFNEAMNKVARSIGGRWDENQKQLIADIPRKEDLEALRQALILKQNEGLNSYNQRIEQLQKEFKNLENGMELAVKKTIKEINGSGNLYRYSSPMAFKEANYYQADVITTGDDKLINYRKRYKLNFGALNYYKWEVNTKYTFSFTIKTDTDGVVIDNLNDGYYNHSQNIPLPKDTWVRKSITFTPTYYLSDNGIALNLKNTSSGSWYSGWVGGSNDIENVWIKEFQLEKGEVDTGQKVNSDDEQAVYGNIYTKITENSTKIQAFEDKINLKANRDEITQSLNQQLEPLKNDIKQQASQIELLPDKLTETVSKKIYETTISGLVQRLEAEEAKRETLSNKINDTVSIQQYQAGIDEARTYTEEQVREAKQQSRQLSNTLINNAQRDTRNYVASQLKDVANNPEIQASIQKANSDAQEALKEYVRAQDELKAQEAQAYADGKISEEEQRAIQDAKEKFEQAKIHAENKADEAKRLSNQFSNSLAQNTQRDARSYTDGQIRNSNRERDQILTQYDTRISQNGQEIIQRITKNEFNATNRTLSNILSEIVQNITDGTTIRYDDNGVAQSLNVGPNGIRLNADKIDISANREINLLVQNMRDKVDKNDIINSINLSTEGVDINANRVGIKGGDSKRYIQIQNDEIRLGGVVTRSWRGRRTTDDIFTSLKDGYLRFRNNSTQGSLYMSHFGISTFDDGGQDGGSSGTIQWWDTAYSEGGQNGITINSYGGVVALTSDYNRIVLESYASSNIKSKQAPVYLYPNTEKVPGLNRFAFTLSNADSAYTSDGYIMFGSDENYDYGAGIRFSKQRNKGLVQVVDGNYATGGDTTIEAGLGKFNLVKRRDGNSYVSIQSYDLLAVGSDNAGDRVASNSIYRRTYSAPANLHVTSAGTIGRSTSAKKYKLSIENQYSDDNKQLEHSKNILDLNIRTWYDKSESEIMAKELSNETKLSHDTFKLHRYAGLIAEEVEELGLSEFVIYDDSGEVEGIAYDRLWVHLIPIIRDQQKRIEKLEAEKNGN